MHSALCKRWNRFCFLQHFKSYVRFQLTDANVKMKRYMCVCVHVFKCLSLCEVASSKTSHYALGLCSHWHRVLDPLTKIVW